MMPEDRSFVGHAYVYDKFGLMKDHSKNSADIDTSNEITEKLIRDIYGKRLKSYNLHTITSDELTQMISDVDQNEFLFQLKPARFLSKFHNIESAYNLIEQYENEHGFSYENIIIARPGLAFYSALSLSKLRKGSMLIPSGMGFHPHTGTRNYGLVQPLYYKNALNGTCIPTGMHFNDQLMALKRTDCIILKELLSDCVCYIKNRVLLTPESILFYHFNSIHNLNIVPTDKWLYEKFRVRAPEIENITNLPLIERFNSHLPIVK
ncbi:MAG: hypothetical protein QRY16_13640 [Enterobacterales bacterium endosymbiont of Blomia tropicalis]|uniref:hypothetical protein n=1 Tax=Mixta mediterraneensis TaxID=2758443 RepID=UPI0025A7D74A|nr:hypothetical protein [Mixta mediterraneensis]MDL4914796.1 hypothetical protein [Mixta mediterraneensis]